MSLGLNSDSGPVAGGVRLTLPSRCVPAALLFVAAVRSTSWMVTISPIAARAPARGQRHIAALKDRAIARQRRRSDRNRRGERLGRQLVLRERRVGASARPAGSA
jgi:hypothetical protein